MVDSAVSDERASRGDEVSMIVTALREKFGNDARAVARIQIEKSTGDIRMTWEAVFSELSR